jgi:lactate dehydrogenase-like 2-hydroxyacid dehydrogenase
MKSGTKLFVLDPLWDGLIKPQQLTALKGAGLEIIVDKVPKPLREVTGLFEGTEPRILAVNPDYVEWSLKNTDYEKIPHLKAILTQSTSTSWIEPGAAKKLDIAICDIRNFSTESVAEWTVLMLLSLARKLPLLIKRSFPFDYEDQALQGIELKGKTVGIVGMGHIGTAVAERCQGLGMNVVYWSRKSRDKRFEYISLEQVFQADVVIPTMEDNTETNKLITSKLLRSMRPSALFVSIVHHYYDHALLLRMVEQGKLLGYGFESPKATDFMSYEGNVWAAPAYAWCTNASMSNAMRLWVDNMIAAGQNKFPGRVN